MTIPDIDKSLVDLQRIAEESLPVGRRSVSRNAREFYSEYFVEKDGKFESYEKGDTRYYAIIRVLGDRRPYDMDVDVVEEHKHSRFQKVGSDERLARVIKRRVQKTLYERREDRNIIDDFRPF